LLIDGVEIPAAFTTPPEPRQALLLIPGSLNSDVDGNFAPLFPGQPASTPHMYKDLESNLARSEARCCRITQNCIGHSNPLEALLRQILIANDFTCPRPSFRKA